MIRTSTCTIAHVGDRYHALLCIFKVHHLWSHCMIFRIYFFSVKHTSASLCLNEVGISIQLIDHVDMWSFQNSMLTIMGRLYFNDCNYVCFQNWDPDVRLEYMYITTRMSNLISDWPHQKCVVGIHVPVLYEKYWSLCIYPGICIISYKY